MRTYPRFFGLFPTDAAVLSFSSSCAWFYFAQVHHARVPRRRPLCWCVGNHEHRIPRPRSPVRKPTHIAAHCAYHTNSAVVSGARLRIVNSAIAMGARIMSARSEARFLSLLSPVQCRHRGYLDLGRYRQATLCYWCPHQDGAVCPKAQAQAKVVDTFRIFPTVYCILVLWRRLDNRSNNIVVSKTCATPTPHLAPPASKHTASAALVPDGK
jgi:hypothetical protein